MREIKFRCWDDTYKYINYKVIVGMHGDDVMNDDNYTACSMWVDPKNVDYKCEPHWCHFEPYHKNIKLMQYTGLKDINGIEIYEGDIVLIKNNKFKVKFQIGSFMLVKISQETDMYELFKDCWNDDVYPLSQYIWNYKEDLEIVGNIYEGDYK